MNRNIIHLVAVLILTAGLCHVLHGTASAVEIHAVGDAGYKYVDGEWINTIPERLGELKSIWAFSEDDIFVGNDDGAVFQFDGYDWRCIFVDSNDRAIEDIWGTSNTNLYVCAVRTGYGQSKFLHFDGSTWSEIVLPYQGDWYKAVYGFSEDDIYMVGYDSDQDNIIYHNDNGDPQSWELVKIKPPIEGLELNCTCVWGSSGDDVFIGDSGGDILHYNGHGWELMESGTIKFIDDIWGVSANDVFAVTTFSILHFDGSEWAEMPVPTSIYMDWIRGTSSDNILVGGLGDNILHFDGSVWTEVSNEDLSYSKDAFMFRGDYAVIVDRDGRLFRYTGSALERFDQEYWWIEPLESVSGTATNSVYAVGAEGYVYRYDGVSWGEMARPTTDRLDDIIAFSDDDICVLSSTGETFHYDGMFWETIGGGEMWGAKMWGLSSDNLYTIGSGSIYHYDGDSWTRVLYNPSVCDDPPFCESGSSYSLTDIWGASNDDIYVVGHKNTWGWWGVHHVSYSCPLIYHYNGIEWARQSLPFYCPIGDPPQDGLAMRAIWGSSAADIWAGGRLYCYSYPSYFLRSDGIDWSESYAPFWSCAAIWGTSSTDVYFLDGYEGDVYHYDGVEFSLADITHVRLKDIWGTDITLANADITLPRYVLNQNHPNPFNPNTTISFSLRERGHATLAVYDVAGRLVHVLVEDVIDAGPHKMTWDGRDKAGLTVASGVYFYRLEVGGFIETRKMVLLR